MGDRPRDDQNKTSTDFGTISLDFLGQNTLFEQILYRNEQLGGPGFLCLINFLPAFLKPNRSCIQYVDMSLSCTKYYGDASEKKSGFSSQFHPNC